jgi:hypothetical protein
MVTSTGISLCRPGWAYHTRAGYVVNNVLLLTTYLRGVTYNEALTAHDLHTPAAKGEVSSPRCEAEITGACPLLVRDLGAVRRAIAT